jgi:hypothetical protein
MWGFLFILNIIIMPTVIIPDKICSHCGETKWYVNQKTGQHICYKRILESNKRYHTSAAGKKALKRAKQKQSENLTDYYIVNNYYVNVYILNGIKINRKDVTKENIETQRNKIKLQRKLNLTSYGNS